jgi:alkyldihydroxyacetonephosphate synthase
MPVDPPYVNEAFLADIKGHYSRLSFDDDERTLHSHGHTLREVYALKYGKFERFADCVVFPSSHEHVEAIVKAAVKHNVVLIPYGGGTNVTQALLLSPKEKRMIVSVDTARVYLSI